MKRLNKIKVFHPYSKRADFTIEAPTPSKAEKKLVEELGDVEVGKKAQSLFRSLRAVGGDYATFHHNGRKIKVEMPKLAA